MKTTEPSQTPTPLFVKFDIKIFVTSYHFARNPFKRSFPFKTTRLSNTFSLELYLISNHTNEKIDKESNSRSTLMAKTMTVLVGFVRADR
jgi:hypothetical protein